MIKRTPIGIVASGDDVFSEGFRIASELQREIDQLKRTVEMLEKLVLGKADEEPF